jgi:hypothetical protein
MDTLIRDYPSTESSNNKDRSIAAAIRQGDSTNHNSNNSETSHRKPLLHQPQGIRPFHYPLQQSPRSLSFSGSASASNIHRSSTAATPHSDSGDIFATSPLRKSQTVGKTSKKGFKSRFKKLRRKQGSSGSRETSSTVNAFITSGDSDSEAAFGKNCGTEMLSHGPLRLHTCGIRCEKVYIYPSQEQPKKKADQRFSASYLFFAVLI